MLPVIIIIIINVLRNVTFSPSWIRTNDNISNEDARHKMQDTDTLIACLSSFCFNSINYPYLITYYQSITVIIRIRNNTKILILLTTFILRMLNHWMLWNLPECTYARDLLYSSLLRTMIRAMVVLLWRTVLAVLVVIVVIVTVVMVSPPPQSFYDPYSYHLTLLQWMYSIVSNRRKTVC